MKTRNITFNPLLIFLIVILPFNGCDNLDDTNEIDSSLNTFLEKLDGTVWEYTWPDDDKNTDYIKFKNDRSAPLKEWWGHYEDNSCFEYAFHSPEYEFTEVIENSEYNLTVVYTDLDGEYVETYKLTLSGNSLRKHVEFADEHGPRDFELNLVYRKSTFNVDAINCEYD